METKTIVLHEDRAVTLTCFLQPVEGEFGFPKRPAMVVLPGGGYEICSEREADPVALAYSQAGYQTFILRYTLKKNGLWPCPLEDYDEAIDLIKKHADEWHVDTDRIAVAGFSAGGHLAACAATMARNKPAAAVLVYTPTLQEMADLCQSDIPLPHEHVDADTSPCFFAAARDDRVVDIRNTLTLEMALAEHGVPFESHIYAYGGHGFSTGEPWVVTSTVCPRLTGWVSDSVEWLGEVMGSLTYSGFTEPCDLISTNGDNAPILSVMISVDHARKQAGEAQVVLSPVFESIRQVAKERGFSYEALLDAVGPNTLREVMETMQYDDETIKMLDAKLHAIVNSI